MNTLYLRIKELADSKKVSLAQVERDLNFSNGLISTWKKGKASADKVTEIAKYFNVSTDFLLGNDATPEQSDPISYYRIDTTGLDLNEIEDIKKQLDDYTAFLTDRLKKRESGD